MNGKNSVLLELGITEEGYEFAADIQSALEAAVLKQGAIENVLEENTEKLKALTPECDKLDYVLAASSGAICGIVDIFLVGKPGESPAGKASDKWIENRVKDFAKVCGWDEKEDSSVSSAIRKLEEKFRVPYDQTGAGDAGSEIFHLNPRNHHFKSLSHNPTLLGLFCSILDQFQNTSHFVSEGELIILHNADGRFVLKGNNFLSKLFAGIVNWFGHLISDMSGSSGGTGRGMGIPSPLWSWANDIIAIKRKLKIPVSEFDESFNKLALKIYQNGYDARFQATQAIPVLINELFVRLIYSVRRMIKYFMSTVHEERSIKSLWKSCEPFSNATVKRMLTVAHGTFCLIDAGDAVVHGVTKGGGSFSGTEFFMRLNIVGIGRFTVSLYGEATRTIERVNLQSDVIAIEREKAIVDDYIRTLNDLAERYDDKDLLTFVDDLKNSEMYIRAFKKTVVLAEKRGVPDSAILRNKSDIDNYFRRKSGQ